MKFNPTRLNVVIEPDEARAKSDGGIILPDAVKKKPQYGKVLAVGPGAHVSGTFVDPHVQVGQRVLFQPFAGHVIETKEKGEKKEVLIMDEGEILAVIEKE